MLALAETRGASGRQVLDALVLGIDVACRIGNTIYPDHYDRGWHITGSTGTLGAAAGCARLLGLDAQRTTMALGIAASQPVGLREQFGTMTKPFHPGAAARAGLGSALMALHGFTASLRALEAPRGFVQVVSTRHAWHEVTDALGERFEISFNTYKPFACGIVIHPSIDACVQLRAQGVTAEQVERIELRVHSLVLELTGKKEPQDGLQGKFSVYHGCAVGLLVGRAGEAEYDDAVVNRPDVVALRRKVQATVDDGIDEAAADVTAVLTDGRRVHVRVEDAIGSLQRPLTDAQLDDKFAQLVDPVLGAVRTQAIGDVCRRLATLPDVRELLPLCCPPMTLRTLPQDLVRRRLCAAGGLLLTGCAAMAPPDLGAVRAELAPGGTLRAAINFGNPILATRGSAGEAQGVSVDLAREAARRLGLPVELVLFNSAGNVVEAVKARQVDLAFVAIDPVRAADTEYTAPYVIIEGAYLVKSGSALQRNEEVDRAGTRVAVGRGSAYDLYLTRELKAATLVRAPTSPAVTDLFLAQNLDVAAGVRQQLEADAQRVGGVRLLPGRFMVIEQAMGVPKGRTRAQAWLSGFIEEMKASGFVAEALRRHAIQGAAVAPRRAA